MNDLNNPCFFCDWNNKSKHTVLRESSLFYVRLDNKPVTVGHVEIVPKRHVTSIADLTQEEWLDIHQLAKDFVKHSLANNFCDGFTIGINEGEAAGRAIHHFHLHLIPRVWGDVANPRGGIRNIIPGKGDYR